MTELARYLSPYQLDKDHFKCQKPQAWLQHEPEQQQYAWISSIGSIMSMNSTSSSTSSTRSTNNTNSNINSSGHDLTGGA
jgi:hypothetical protein